MTFTIRHRPLPGAPFMAEYQCDCSRSEQLVARDEAGDPPSSIGICTECGELRVLADSAPHPKVLSVPCSAVSFGGDMKDRPPGMLDTRPLAEGMPMKEWRKVQDKHREERRHQKLIKRGLKTKRVQSP